VNAVMARIRRCALSHRYRIFEQVMDLDFDSVRYLGHLVTKNAIDKGFCEKRKNLKGQTLVEWSRSSVMDGPGAPNQWACISGVDLLINEGQIPDADDSELWACILYYWSVPKGSFDSVEDVMGSLPTAFLDQVDVPKVMLGLNNLSELSCEKVH